MFVLDGLVVWDPFLVTQLTKRAMELEAIL
jgi:hypothetical protein